MNLLKLTLISILLLHSLNLLPENKNNDLEDTRVKYENQIHERFDGVLKKILPEKTFSLVVNVQLSVEKVDVLISKKIKKQESQDETISKSRPGFESALTVPNTPEKDNSSEEDFAVQNEIKLESVEFFLVLDKTLPESLQILAKNALTSKMEKNFDTKASLRTEISDLLAYDPILTGSYWSNFLQKNLLQLLYLLIGFILILVLFFFKLNRRKHASKSEEPSTPREFSPPQNAEKEVTIEETLETLRRSILIAYKKDNDSLRSFIKGLNEKNIKIIAKSMLDSIFYDQITKYSDIVISSDLENESFEKNTIEKLTQNLNDYVALHNVSLSTPFGFLNRLDAEIIYDKLKDSKEELALVISFLSDSQVKQLLSIMGIGKKAEILSILTKEDFFDGKAQMINELEVKLRSLYDEEKSKVGYDKNSQKNSLDLMLNNDKEVALTLEVAKSDHKINLGESYSVFTITFEKAIEAENIKEVKKVLTELDNNIVIACLSALGNEKEKEFLNLLPLTRQKIIASIRKNLKITDEVRTDAKQAFLKIYRSIAQETISKTKNEKREASEKKE